MTDDQIEARAKELQQMPDPAGLFTPSPWWLLVESSREYWRRKARAETDSQA